jgi:DNA repair protein radC
MHEGHRERVRKRFIKEGIDSFEQHQILELILFYAIPRKDTNEIAHRLLEKFGTLSRVLEAEPKDLMQIPDVGENAACLLSLFAGVFRVYSQDKMKKKTVLNHLEDIFAYVRSLYHGRLYETFFLISLDAQNRALHSEIIMEGTIDEIAVYPRLVVEAALRHKAYSVIIAHNHPGGSVMPSKVDVEATRHIAKALKTIDIGLKDHIIVTNENCLSFREMKLLN